MLGKAVRPLVVAVVVTLAGAGCSSVDRPQRASLSSESSEISPGSGAESGAEPEGRPRVRATKVTTVVAVSIDGLNPVAIRELGARGTPTLHRLMRQGASTLNARTEREQTNTLPNHAGMLTGRRIDASSGGHGVTWNDDRTEPTTVQEAAGHPVSSVFRVIDSARRDTALFASKQKFRLFERSWDQAIDRFEVRAGNARLVRLVRADIADKARTFRFVHLSLPDRAGHEHGFMGRKYLRAVEETDRLVGRIMARLEGKATLRGRTAVVVTSDHGGRGLTHRDPTELRNYRVPFLVWGAGVAAGADLYELNPDYADPGRSRTTYQGEQPVRNGALANLVTDLLGLPKVRGSEHDADQDLDWH